MWEALGGVVALGTITVSLWKFYIVKVAPKLDEYIGIKNRITNLESDNAELYQSLDDFKKETEKEILLVRLEMLKNKTIKM